MRVTIPVNPHFKTASEVVPHVIADTSPDNELEFEWILMTRLPGVCLKDLWSSPQLLWEEKVGIIETIAGYIQQMQSNCFDNLYLSNQIHHPLQRVHSGRENFIPLAANPQFSIGPIVAIPFFMVIISSCHRIAAPSPHLLNLS
jgi:hypothetical protein